MSLFLVFHHISFCKKLFPTQDALVEFNYFSACLPMSLQIRFCEQSLIAYGTWKRLLFQMSETVIVVMVFVHETFSTYLTYKVKALLMASHMKLIVVCRAKLFSAIFLLTRDKYLFLKQIKYASFHQKVHSCEFELSKCREKVSPYGM